MLSLITFGLGRRQMASLTNQFHQLRELIMTTQAELAQGLRDIGTQLQKVSAESTTSLDKIRSLEEAIANNGGVSAEVDAAFQELKRSVQAVDDLIPDPTELPVGTDPATGEAPAN